MDTGDDLGQWMMHKRTLKSGRKKKEKGSKADPKCEICSQVWGWVNPV
jgi:ribosomal protein S26